MLRINCKALALALSLAISATLLSGCSGKEERQAKYLARAQEYFANGNYDKARIEAKNVLQIDANNAEAHYVFAEIAEKEGNWQQMFGELNAAINNDPKMLKARVKLAQLFVLVNQLDKAAEQAAKINEQEPGSADYYAVTAAIAARQKETDKAVENAQKALSVTPGHIGATAILASIYVESDPAKAEQVVAESLRINPNEIDLHLLQVQIFAKQEKVDETIDSLKRLIAHYPEKLNYITHLAGYYAAQNRPADAEALLRQTIKDKPDNTDIKLTLVDFLAKQGKPEAAIEQLSQFLKAEPDNYKLRSTLARAQLASKEPDKAIATYQYTIDKDVKGEGIEARNRVIEILLAQNKRKEAEALLKDVLKLEPGNADALLIRARLELADNNTEAAIADLRTVLKATPDASQALLLLAAAHERTGSPSLALDSYQKILQSNGNDLAALTGAARLQLAANQLEEAEKLLNHARALSPTNVDISRLIVELYTRKKQWEPALELADKLTQDSNSAAIGHYLKGLVLLQKRDTAEAIESLKKALEKEPRAIEPLQALMAAYANTKQIEAATTYLEAHVKKYPDQIHAQELLSSLYRQTGKLEQAETLLVDVIKKQPSRIGAYRELLAVYSMQKQPAKMTALIESGLQHNPNNLDLMLLKAQLQQGSGQYQQAVDTYKQILAVQPKSDITRNNLAAVLIDRFPTEENLREAQSLIADFDNSKNPNFLDTLAWLHYKQKNYPQAISLLEGVLSRNYDAPELRYHLGMAYLKSGAPDKAKIELTKATATKAQFTGREEAEAELKKL